MMKSKTKTFGLSILLIFSLLIFPNIGMACFNPTDSFATEVALNKPSITYDLSGIKQSKDVAVVLTEEEWESQKYLNVKIQVPTKRVHKRMDYVEIVSIANVDVASLDINASEELGWNAKISGGGCYYNEQLDKEICRNSYCLDKGDVHIYLTGEGRVSTEKTEVRISVDNTKTIKTEMFFFEKCSWVNPESKYACCFECDKAFSKSAIGVGEVTAMCGRFSTAQPLSEKCKTFFENNPMSVSACQKPLELGLCEMVVGYYYDVKYDGCCAVSGCKYIPEVIPFQTQEECQANCKKEVGYQIAEVLVKIGFSKDIEEALQIVKNKAEHKINEWEDLEPVINLDIYSFNIWKRMLKTELEWLRDNNVISGLTDDDIYGIIKVADKGTAGWNSKIRYFKGKWVQGITEEMSEETGIYMIRSLDDCGGFPIGLLPEKVPNGVATSHHPLPFTEMWRAGKGLVVGVIITISLIVGIVLCGIRIRKGRMKKKNLLCRLFGLVGIAFICGVIFQFIQVVVFDTFGIDSFLGIFMVPSLVIMPVLISMVVSHFYHKDKIYVIITGIATLVFAVIALSMYLIG